MQMPNGMFEWLKEHAELRGDRYFCKKTGAEIKSCVVGRSIWIRPLSMAGTGEVRQVLHVACMACSPDATPPRYGEGIHDDELIESNIRAIA